MSFALGCWIGFGVGATVATLVGIFLHVIFKR